MPLVQPADRARFVIKAGLTGGESMTHTFHLQSIINADSPFLEEPKELVDLTTRVAKAWGDFLTLAAPTSGGVTYRSLIPNGTTYSSVDGYLMDGITGRAKAAATVAIPGTITGTSLSALPTSLALVATLRTAVPSRSSRGRIFLGGLGQSMLTGAGRVDPDKARSIAFGLARFYKAIRDDNNSLDRYQAVVYSPTLNRGEKITSVSVGDVWDNMSSRRASLTESRVSAGVA